MASRKISPCILGLDQSLNRSGYCILEAKTGNIITTGVIQPPKRREKLPLKLIYLKTKILQVLNEYKPSYIYLEDVYKGKELQAVKTVLEILFIELSYPYFSLSPRLASPRSWRTLNGLTSSDKSVWQNLINEPDPDIADSIGIGRAGLILKPPLKI